MTAPITIEVFDGASPASSIVALAKPLGKAWLDQLNDVGSGTIQVRVSDADLLAHPTLKKRGNIIRFKLRGTERFGAVIERRSCPPAPPGEHSQRLWTLSGRGVLSILERAIVFPEGPVEGRLDRQRAFDWTPIAYDDSSWIAATQLQRQDSSSGAEPHWFGFPANWPDPTAYWIWSRARGATYPVMPIGNSFFRKTFSVAADTDVAIFGTCDNQFNLWLDGEMVLEGSYWKETYRADRKLVAGTHQIAAIGGNIPLANPGPTAKDPAGLLVSLIETDESLNPAGAVVVHSDSSWLCLDYPVSVPGMSIGQILRILIEEAQARGVLPGMTWDFTDTLDSNGVAWAQEPNMTLDIGTNLLDVLRTFIEQFVDADMTPALVLHIFNKGTLGVDLTGDISLAVGVGLAEEQAESEPHLMNAVLARATTGELTEEDDATSLASHIRIETYLELALAPDMARARAMVDEIFTEASTPTTQITAQVPESAGPYTDWQKGDAILMPDLESTEQPTTVLSIGVSEDAAGNPVFNIEGAQFDATA